MTQHPHEEPSGGSREFWEGRYRESERVWSGQPNAALVDIAQNLAPGKALDLGCGEGADAIWLASRGWTVTGVDISATAIDRARSEAERAGVASSTRFVAADLADWQPDDGPYDLVAASFLHSPVDFPRTEVLRRAAASVSAGGRLAIVSHAAPPPWMDAGHHPPHSFSSPAEQLEELRLEDGEWRMLSAETRARRATGPSGEPAELLDGVLLIERL